MATRHARADGDEARLVHLPGRSRRSGSRRGEDARARAVEKRRELRGGRLGDVAHSDATSAAAEASPTPASRAEKAPERVHATTGRPFEAAYETQRLPVLPLAPMTTTRGASGGEGGVADDAAASDAGASGASASEATGAASRPRRGACGRGRSGARTRARSARDGANGREASAGGEGGHGETRGGAGSAAGGVRAEEATTSSGHPFCSRRGASRARQVIRNEVRRREPSSFGVFVSSSGITPKTYGQTVWIDHFFFFAARLEKLKTPRLRCRAGVSARARRTARRAPRSRATRPARPPMGGPRDETRALLPKTGAVAPVPRAREDSRAPRADVAALSSDASGPRARGDRRRRVVGVVAGAAAAALLLVAALIGLGAGALVAAPRGAIAALGDQVDDYLRAHGLAVDGTGALGKPTGRSSRATTVPETPPAEGKDEGKDERPRPERRRRGREATGRARPTPPPDRPAPRHATRGAHPPTRRRRRRPRIRRRRRRHPRGVRDPPPPRLQPHRRIRRAPRPRRRRSPVC